MGLVPRLATLDILNGSPAGDRVFDLSTPYRRFSYERGGAALRDFCASDLKPRGNTLTKRSAKPKRRNGRYEDTAEIIPLPKLKHHAERTPPPIRPLNPAQAEYLDALRTQPASHRARPRRLRQDLDRRRLRRRSLPRRPDLAHHPDPPQRAVRPLARLLSRLARRQVRALGGAGARRAARAHGRGGVRHRAQERRDRTGAVRGDARPLLAPRLRAARRGAERDGGADEDVPHPHRRGLPASSSTATPDRATSARPRA